MKVGIVCEGPTDYFAITEFFGDACDRAGVEVEFGSVQPSMDETRNGGWASIYTWFLRFPARARLGGLLGGGLFDGELNAKRFDCLLVQMDTDIYEADDFRAVFEKVVGRALADNADSSIRKAEIRCFLEACAQFDSMTQAECNLHIITPASESTENWCVAAFERSTIDLEWLGGEELCNRFMTALHLFEGRPIPPQISATNKDVNRRRRFCKGLRDRSTFVSSSCSQFDRSRLHLISLA